MSPLSDADCSEIREALKGKATGYRYEQVARWLERAGFIGPKKPSGSHRTWVHPVTKRRVPLVDTGKGHLLPVYVKRAARAILETGACGNVEVPANDTR